jgi:hypothetical protein
MASLPPPLYFIENRGQVDPAVRYYARGEGWSLFCTAAGLTFALAPWTGRPGAAVQLTPVEGHPGMTLTPAAPQPGRVHYLTGRDPGQWRTRLPTYGAVLYRNVFPGVDLKFYGSGRHLEYDLIVHPGADPARIRFRFAGVRSLEISREGDLSLLLPGGERLVQKKPLIYQETAAGRVLRAGKFRLNQDGYGFELAAYDRGSPLIIDPVLQFSTYLGGSGDDRANALAVDGEGCVYVAGRTDSLDFPQKNPLRGPHLPDAFVTKLAPDGGSLVFSTFLGGSGDDAATGIGVDGSGNVYVAGYTDSLDFPAKNAFQNANKGDVTAFVAKLAPDGASLDFSTYLGGSVEDRANALAVATVAGETFAYVAGVTSSLDFPVKNAFQNLSQGGADAFVTKFKAGGGVAYSTFLGGRLDDEATGIAVDAAGSAYITGFTGSLNFPVKNAFQTKNHGTVNAFVTKLKAGGGLAYSTYLGGSASDFARAIALDNPTAGHPKVFVTGEATSSNFPLKNPLLSVRKGNPNVFITKLTGSGSGLVYSTYLGGTGSDQALGIGVDTSVSAKGQAVVTGVTTSYDFPMKNALQANFLAPSDAFVSKLGAGGGSLVFSTFLGGNKADAAQAVAVDQAGDIFLTGVTSSINFPIQNPFQAGKHGGTDAFVTKIRP